MHDPLRTPPPHERLDGPRVTDASGQEVEPSQAMPFPGLGRVSTVLVQRELNYLYWLASQVTGAGRVIDLGCFLGGSTTALAKGLAIGARAAAPLLSYDSFETPHVNDPSIESLYERHGLKPGRHFRADFDRLCQFGRDELVVREGWLPEDASRDQETALYPEQQAIELLFIDLAKTWGVHLTVLRAFGRHLLKGATVVQRDFFDLNTPWIPLHLWQLRDVLKPIDAIHGTPSLGLRCVQPVDEHLVGLWTRGQLRDHKRRRAAWDRVLAYWEGLLGSAARCLMGHAAMHAWMDGDSEDALSWARQYETWRRSAQSRHSYIAPVWSAFLEQRGKPINQVSQKTTPAGVSGDGITRAWTQLAAASFLRGNCAERRHHIMHGQYVPKQKRLLIWGTTLKACVEAGHRRIALYGAGEHTRWLLKQASLFENVEVACVVDDHAAARPIAGLDVVTPDQSAGVMEGVTAILPSSDRYERELLERAQTHWRADSGVEVLCVYESPDREQDTALMRRYHPGSCEDQQACIEFDLDPDTRAFINKHPWAEALVDSIRVPAWGIALRDAAFLWQLIEACRPTTIVEIGTAAGVSTGSLLAAVDRFCNSKALVYSFDLLSRCYFDWNRHVGDALRHVSPHLLDRAILYANADAVDAASCFEPGELDFAFIDGNHQHPQPTLDLLALLPVLRPGAWVALHDIELDAFWVNTETGKRDGGSGARRLYEAWPFKKHKQAGATPPLRNIGAIQIPSSSLQTDAEAVLLRLLTDQPYEIQTELLSEANELLTTYQTALGH